MTKITAEIPANVAMHVNALVERMALSDDRPNSHGKLTIEFFIVMLLEDVALAIRRPGSWEGANMIAVLTSHGYEV